MSEVPLPPSPPEPITVVVAHRREADRSSLAHWLGADARYRVVAEAGDAATARTAIRDAVPAVALIDVDLDDGPETAAADTPAGASGGLALMAEIRDTLPAVHLVAIADEDDAHAYAALGAGAVGCYLWSDPARPVTAVVAGVARGEGVLTPGWATRLVDEIDAMDATDGPVPPPELTPTEREVLRRVSSGATAAAVATLHDVTEHAVNLYAGSVITKVQRHQDDVRRLQART
jgi:DNA-binding NarL/FixJ family response regulator